MKKGNRISAVLSDPNLKKILEHLSEVEKLLPFLLTLTPDEAKRLRNLGVDGVPYAQAGLDAVRANLDFTRRSFELAEYEQDVVLLEQLRQVRAVVGPLAQKLENTYRLTGADVMVTADDIYEDIRKDNGETAAVQTAYQQMRRRYQHRTAAAPAKPTPPAA